MAGGGEGVGRCILSSGEHCVVLLCLEGSNWLSRQIHGQGTSLSQSWGPGHDRQAGKVWGMVPALRKTSHRGEVDRSSGEGCRRKDGFWKPRGFSEQVKLFMAERAGRKNVENTP